MKEHAPAFLFYVEDFLNDEEVATMSSAEFGVFVRLLAQAWREGSISSDPSKLACLVRETLPSFKKIWPKVMPCFVARPDGRLINPRQERERAKEVERQKVRDEKAKKAAEARWRGKQDHPSGDAPSIPQAKDEHPTNPQRGDPKNANRIELNGTEYNSVEPNGSPPLGAGESEGASSEDEPKTPVQLGPALDFAMWFVKTGIEIGALPPDRDLDAMQWALRESEADCEALIASYGRGESEARARRLFALKNAGKLNASPTIQMLRKSWDWAEIRSDKPPTRPSGGRAPKIVPGFDPMAGFNDPCADHDDEQEAAGGAQ